MIDFVLVVIVVLAGPTGWRAREPFRPVVHLLLGVVCALGAATRVTTVGARSQGYTITLDELRPALAAALGSTGAPGTGAC